MSSEQLGGGTRATRPRGDWRSRLYRKTCRLSAWDWREDPRPHISFLCEPFHIGPPLGQLDPEYPEKLLKALAHQHRLHLYDVPSCEGQDMYGFILSKEPLTAREIRQIDVDSTGEDFAGDLCDRLHEAVRLFHDEHTSDWQRCVESELFLEGVLAFAAGLVGDIIDASKTARRWSLAIDGSIPVEAPTAGGPGTDAAALATEDRVYDQFCGVVERLLKEASTAIKTDGLHASGLEHTAEDN